MWQRKAREAVICSSNSISSHKAEIKQISLLSESDRSEILLNLIGAHPSACKHRVARWKKMASWIVDELAEFLADEDLRGPAEDLRKAGVSGTDFLAWGTAAELQVDLRLAPFTARKLLATRDAYLSEFHVTTCFPSCTAL